MHLEKNCHVNISYMYSIAGTHQLIQEVLLALQFYYLQHKTEDKIKPLRTRHVALRSEEEVLNTSNSTGNVWTTVVFLA